MTTTENIYRSILAKISTLPPLYLQQLDEYAKQLNKRVVTQKRDNHNKIMAMAGGWSDMSERDFSEYLAETQKTGDSIFKDIEF